jgi:hypothetical protein
MDMLGSLHQEVTSGNFNSAWEGRLSYDRTHKLREGRVMAGMKMM